MPAVKAFALYAAVALSLNFFMQITCFIAIMALDAKRQDQSRFDIFCCWGSKPEGGENLNKAEMSAGECSGILYYLTFILDYIKNYVIP